MSEELKLIMPNSDIFIPVRDFAHPQKDTSLVEVANILASTTHLGVGAHQDDLAIMCREAIMKCYRSLDYHFTGVTGTTGHQKEGGVGPYLGMDGEDIELERFMEQRIEAIVGKYNAQLQLGYSSEELKETNREDVRQDLFNILRATNPEAVYTHVITDKHSSHVGVAVRLIEAIREMPIESRPKTLYGCEVWRSLDWLPEEYREALDVSNAELVGQALVSLPLSQLFKARYDKATKGRIEANATWDQSHMNDTLTGIIYVMNMTPLITEPTRDIIGYHDEIVDAFGSKMADTIRKVSE